jgi:predicted adenylyl cyclase CyaB
MSNKDIEIEIKLPLNNVEDVRKFLNDNAKLVSKDIFQRDTYYTPAHRDFLQVKYPFEWLRLRESAREISLNYKHFHPENAEITDYCDEYESGINNKEGKKFLFEKLEELNADVGKEDLRGYPFRLLEKQGYTFE